MVGDVSIKFELRFKPDCIITCMWRTVQNIFYPIVWFNNTLLIGSEKVHIFVNLFDLSTRVFNLIIYDIKLQNIKAYSSPLSLVS